MENKNIKIILKWCQIKLTMIYIPNCLNYFYQNNAKMHDLCCFQLSSCNQAGFQAVNAHIHYFHTCKISFSFDNLQISIHQMASRSGGRHCRSPLQGSFIYMQALLFKASPHFIKNYNLMEQYLKFTPHQAPPGLPRDEYLEYLELIDNFLIQERHKNIPRKFEDRLKEDVQKLHDIRVYSYKLRGQPEFDQQQRDEEDERDEELRRRIEQYNRVAKANKEKENRERRSRRNDGREGQHKRKVRTTITQAKLDEMNRIFSLYLEYREREDNGEQFDGEGTPPVFEKNEFSSLKNIGQRLGLGYSTILHKFREFRATKKVKGGALIAALHQKRKYKKSKKIEEFIMKSLAKQKFYTAVQLSEYISKTYNVKLSRSIISRHLGEMGYSYKNIKTKPPSKNTSQIKQVRKSYATALNYLQTQKGAEVYYVDEYSISLSEIFNRRSHNQDSQQGEELVLLIVSTANAVVKIQMKNEPFKEDEFERIFDEFIESVNIDQMEKIVVMDIDNKMHYSDTMLILRGRHRHNGFHFFYIPPESGQLNLLQWLFPKLHTLIKNNQYDNIEDVRLGLTEMLTNLPRHESEMLRSCELEVEAHLRKAIENINF